MAEPFWRQHARAADSAHALVGIVVAMKIPDRWRLWLASQGGP
jgi:hypothetical protein